MAETKVGIIIEAEDRATRQLKEVSRGLDGMKGKLESMRPQFQKMAAVGTAAFAAIGAGVFKATQSASDAQEIFSKFDVVFGDVSDQAEKTAQDLRNNFGLAESTAKDLLSSTGDMLTGFGLSGAAALDLAEKTNKLAVDLASFTNIEGGAERASKALTKALLGERESVKELGIAILEEDVKAKIEAMEAAGAFTNETERQKKALATLEIAISQSKNAIGDFARTQDGLANQQRVMQERLKELTETIGTAFIPILQSIVQKAQPVIEAMVQWIEKNPELTRRIALAAAAITGLVAIVGILGLALPAIIAGFTFLASPIGLVILAVTAVVAAFILFREKISEFFAVLDEKTGLITLMREAWEHVTEVFQTALLPALQRLWESMTPMRPFLEFLAKVVGGVVVIAFAALVKGLEWAIVIFSNLLGIAARVQAFFNDVFVATINAVVNTVKKAVEWVDRLIESLKRLNVVQGAKNAVSSAFQSAKNFVGLADGGIVTRPTLAMIGEGGESEAVIPLSKLGAFGGGGVVVNINGGNFLSEDAGLMLGDQIIEVLRRNMRI